MPLWKFESGLLSGLIRGGLTVFFGRVGAEQLYPRVMIGLIAVAALIAVSLIAVCVWVAIR